MINIENKEEFKFKVGDIVRYKNKVYDIHTSDAIITCIDDFFNEVYLMLGDGSCGVRPKDVLNNYEKVGNCSDSLNTILKIVKD